MKRAIGSHALLVSFFISLGVIGCQVENKSNDSGAADSESDSATISEPTPTDDSASEAGDDSETGSNAETLQCDGEDVDCYKDCWGCALEGECAATVASCLADGDENGSGCNAYYTCKNDICCHGDNTCLTGAEWESCMATCRTEHHITREAQVLYQAVNDCVACDVCGISCAQNTNDFAVCRGEDGEDVPCFEEIAEDGEVACFSWAGWGGPCSFQTTACKDNPDCVTLENCVNDTWSSSNAIELQTACFDAADDIAETQYWGYMQCIFCDACELSCAVYADSKNCETYVPAD